MEHNLDPEALRPNLPGGAGVYLFKDASDQVIYVGKAKNLKKTSLVLLQTADCASLQNRIDDETSRRP